MCGFAGEVRFDGRAVDLDAVGRMNARMVRRGPDSCGVWQSGRVGLAHRRLTIIDLSRAGEQPMIDAALGLSLVFNGCIYNYRELRAELSAHGYQFFSNSDSEVILKAYAHWGTRAVEHFLGMFAFVIVERESGRVVMARDRLGIKPLYLARSPGRLRFASTLPALLAGGGVDTSIDPVALHHYMSFHSVVPAPLTILRGVQKLPPATLRVIEADGKEIDHLYWEPSFTRPAAAASSEPVSSGPASSGHWQELVLDRLRTAVKRRMVADVPVGVLLSGGLDSSLIVALLAESGQRDLKTFSIGFEAAGGESGDEFSYSDLVAREFGTDHRQIRIPSDGLSAAIDGAIENMSEPMISHDCVAFYLLSEQVSQHVKVVQSGQGADEIFGGYDWYPPLAGVPRERALEAYAKVFFDQSHAALGQIINPDRLTPTDVSREFVKTHFDRPGAESALDAALRIDSTIMLVDDPVKRVDNMTMAWGLEGRVPFLDHELVEVAASCPPELKLAHEGKGVLKDAARALLPAAIIEREKGYFPVPGIRHLSGPLLAKVREALLCPAARERNLFRPTYVHRLLETPNALRSTLGSNMTWQLGLLELWLQAHGVG